MDHVPESMIEVYAQQIRRRDEQIQLAKRRMAEAVLETKVCGYCGSPLELIPDSGGEMRCRACQGL